MYEQRSDFYMYAGNKATMKSACQYYRIDVPLRSLEQMYGVKCFNDHGKSLDLTLRGLFGSNIALFYGMNGSDFLHQLQTVKAMKAGIRGDGRLQIPPTIIWDCDDNHDFVHPVNTAFSQLGVRGYPDYALLEPGEGLELTLENGELLKIWEDQVTEDADGILFDIARNRKNMELRHQIIRESHGFTAPSKELARYTRDVIGQKNVYVFPNTIIPEDYTDYPLARENPDEIRILWQGSMSHYVDWWPLRDSLKEITEKYPQVKWVIFGELFEKIIKDRIPEDRLEYISWIQYEGYKLRRGLINADINIAPISDNPFNRCKSAIKWYEASIWKNPEATLAQNVGAYKDEIVDGETGLLFNTPEEFVQKLSLLIEDAQLRKRLAANAKEWVLNNRTPKQTIPGLLEFYDECIERRVHESIVDGVSSEEIKRLAKEQKLIT